MYLYCRSTNDFTELHFSLIFKVSLNWMIYLCYDSGKKLKTHWEKSGNNGILTRFTRTQKMRKNLQKIFFLGVKTMLAR